MFKLLFSLISRNYGVLLMLQRKGTQIVNEGIRHKSSIFAAIKWVSKLAKRRA